MNELHDNAMKDRFVPRNYRVHESAEAAERERLEEELGVAFHGSDKLDTFNGIDMIRTGDQ